MTQLQQNRYDQLLRRVADLKGPGSKVNDVLTELFPTLDVENPPAELLLLMGSRLAMGGETIAAPGVAQFAQAMLRNPGGSNALITLLSLRASSLTAQRLVYGPSQNTLSTLEPTAFTDGRVFGEGTIGQVRTESPIAAGATFGHHRAQAGVEVEFAIPRGLSVISPGTAFSISTTDDDTDLTVTFTWLERIAQPSELNL